MRCQNLIGQIGALQNCVNVAKMLKFAFTHTQTDNHFTARLEYVRVHPGEQVPER